MYYAKDEEKVCYSYRYTTCRKFQPRARREKERVIGEADIYGTGDMDAKRPRDKNATKSVKCITERGKKSKGPYENTSGYDQV